MPNPRRVVRMVDPESGEVTPPTREEMEAELDRAEAEARKWHRRCRELERDKDREATEDSLWPVAVELFGEWKLLLNHPRCEWQRERFELVRPFLRKHKHEMCRRAIAGYWFDAWLAPERRNGSRRRVDEWEYIFATPRNFEEGCNKAPAHWEALFLDEDTLKRYAAVPYDERKQPEAPAPTERAMPAQSLFGRAQAG
jgi:hypothetical protein